MPVTFRIAFRNLREHKSKTLIIGIIIAIGIAVLVFGNSMIDTSAKGMRKTFIDNYTGHVMIRAKTEGEISLFGASGVRGAEKIPRIPEYRRIMEYLKDRSRVKGITSQVTGYSTISLEDVSLEDIRIFSILFGIEPESYRTLFDSTDLVAGSYLSPGQEGILLSTKRIDEIEEEYGKRLTVGDKVLLNSIGIGGFKIREVPIRGIFEFTATNEGMEMVSFVDVQTLRALLGMTVGAGAIVDLEEDQTDLLAVSAAEDLFSEEGGDIFDLSPPAQEREEEEFLSILGDTTARDAALEIDSGSWHFILLKLEDDTGIESFLAETNGWLSEEGIDAVAYGWEGAAGPFASSAKILRTVFNVAILIVAIVAVIIIMNTLVISVIERTAEIGTMRALGARKSFVWKMFMAETLTITLFFGLIGMAAGALILYALGLFKIQATNSFTAMLFAGDVFKPAISASSLLYALLTVVGIGLISHLYPVLIALKIEPIRAIRTE